ncbi:hypothetical protein H5410_059757 [Solanum commersonii]|uniref:Uncharacterized protein n=1 Tax=Solanum commersonii TaxID=4109 RepID=A0A9J5W3M2_SOLCO|nr:hypothetical protein H5410_059757 [Solanum commersonii]
MVTKNNTLPYGCGLWRTISEGWEAYRVASLYQGVGRVSVDRWCGESTLWISFPTYIKSQDRKKNVQQILRTQGGGVLQDMIFRRNLLGTAAAAEEEEEEEEENVPAEVAKQRTEEEEERS